MTKTLIHLVMIALISWGLSPRLFGQVEKPEGVYLILDASGSMWGKLADQSYKIHTAKKVLQEFVGGDFQGKELAIRVYGHRREGDCRDSELLIPFGPPDEVASQLAAKVKGITPTGRTPITYSFREALKDFGDRKGQIILISDGIETCDEDPCALMKEWKEKNIAIKVHVVGLGLEEKEKLALSCISDAAETEFQDAGSADELIEGLEETKTGKKLEPIWAALKITGKDQEGNSYKIHGELYQNEEKIQEVESHVGNKVLSGTYTIKVGIMTRNGNLYLPKSKEIAVAEVGETRVDFVVEVPPRVRTIYIEDGYKSRGSYVYVYASQGGEELFHFRWKDEIFIDEGTYEFKSRLNKFNKLAATETFKAGDRKEIVFDLRYLVKVTIKMYASGTKTLFRKNLDLFQEGVKIGLAHLGNGINIPPGTYDVLMHDELGDYLKKDFVITDEKGKAYEIIVPCGHVTFEYHDKAGARDKDGRLWVRKADSKQTKYINSGKVIPIQPGTYIVKGFDAKGDYDEVTFTIKEGEDKTIVLRAK